MRKPFAGRRFTVLTAAACVILGSVVVQLATAGPAAAIPGLRTVTATSPLHSYQGYTVDANKLLE